MAASISKIRFTPNRRRWWSLKRYMPMMYMLVSFAAGSSQSFAFAPYSHWYLLFPGLLWLICCLENKNKASALINGLVYSLGFWASGIYWVYHSIFVYGNAGVVFTPILVGLLCLLMAFIFVILLWLYKKMTANTGLFGYIEIPVIHKIIAFGSIWLASEWIGSALTFPWLGLGNVMIDAPAPLDQWLPIIGASGYSFIIASFTAAVYFTVQAIIRFANNRRKNTELLIAPGYMAVTLLATAGLYLAPQSWTQSDGKTITVALVQPNVPLDQKWRGSHTIENIQNLFALSATTEPEVDLVIWPESAIAGRYSNYRSYIEAITDRLKPKALLTGSLRRNPEDNRVHNSIFLFDQQPPQIYDKQTLVPFGEYIPMMQYFSFLIDLIGLPELGLSPGPRANDQMQIGDFTFAVNICYEITFAGKLVRAGINSNALLTISDDGWFGNTIGPEQHFQMAKVRAKENGRYLVRVANDGITAIINDQGKVEQSIERGIQDTLTATVPGRSGRTPYSYVAGWIEALLILISVTICWFYHLTNRKKIDNQ